MKCTQICLFRFSGKVLSERDFRNRVPECKRLPKTSTSLWLSSKSWTSLKNHVVAKAYKKHLLDVDAKRDSGFFMNIFLRVPNPGYTWSSFPLISLIIIMGKYTKKHEWGPCEFIYKINWNGKKAGEFCGGRSLRRPDGKYFCACHRPDRREHVMHLHRLKAIKIFPQQEARLQARKKMLGLSGKDIAVGSEPEVTRPIFDKLLDVARNVIS